MPRSPCPAREAHLDCDMGGKAMVPRRHRAVPCVRSTVRRRRRHASLEQEGTEASFRASWSHHHEATRQGLLCTRL